MNTQTHLHQGHNFVADLQFLIAQERGPISVKAQIATWIDMLEEDEPQAWLPEALTALCDALSVLAFANAAFRKVPVLSERACMLDFEIEDQGGYFVALKSIENVLAVAPLCNECRKDLARHVQCTLFRHLEQIDRLLSRK